MVASKLSSWLAAGRDPGFHRRARLWWMIALGLTGLVVFGFTLYVGAAALLAALAQFAWSYAPLVLLLSLTNYGLRFLRWELYLRALDLHLPWRASLAVFAGGLFLVVTPGRVGDLSKPLLLSSLRPDSFSRLLPLVLSERLLDLLAVLVLCASAGAGWRFASPALYGAMALGLGVLLLLGAGRRWLPAIGGLSRRWGLGKAQMTAALESVTRLFARRVSAPALGLSLVAWLAEGVGLYLVVRGYQLGLGLEQSVFIYSFSTLAGAITFLPGGLGTTELTMVALLRWVNAPEATAAAATLLIRAATLWFAVLVGGLLLAAFHRALLAPTHSARVNSPGAN